MNDDRFRIGEKRLEVTEEAEARRRQSPSGEVVYEAISKEAEEELSRSTRALFWSGLAAGLSMGFSMIGEGLLRAHLPDAEWTTLVAELGYSFGFLIVILGRQQLFTENTLTPVLPLLQKKDVPTLVNVVRLWSVVLVANLLGALLIAFVAVRTSAFEASTVHQFLVTAREAASPDFGTLLIRGVFAGWLIALLVWMLPFAKTAHVLVIVAIAWLVGVGEFSHIVAGSVEVFSPRLGGRDAMGIDSRRVHRARAAWEHPGRRRSCRCAQSCAGRRREPETLSRPG